MLQCDSEICNIRKRLLFLGTQFFEFELQRSFPFSAPSLIFCPNTIKQGTIHPPFHPTSCYMINFVHSHLCSPAPSFWWHRLGSCPQVLPGKRQFWLGTGQRVLATWQVSQLLSVLLIRCRGGCWRRQRCWCGCGIVRNVSVIGRIAQSSRAQSNRIFSTSKTRLMGRGFIQSIVIARFTERNCSNCTTIAIAHRRNQHSHTHATPTCTSLNTCIFCVQSRTRTERSWVRNVVSGSDAFSERSREEETQRASETRNTRSAADGAHRLTKEPHPPPRQLQCPFSSTWAAAMPMPLRLPRRSRTWQMLKACAGERSCGS